MIRLISFKSIFNKSDEIFTKVNRNLNLVRYRSKKNPIFRRDKSLLPDSYYDDKYTVDTVFTEEQIAEKKEKMETFIRNIDTTLTPEQRIHVDKIKKKIHGGAKSGRSLYRDVPTPDEVVPYGNFLPKMAPNARELIDYCLSKIPERGGYRGGRRKRRMILKHQKTREQAARRKQETHAASYRKQAQAKRQRVLCRMYKDMSKLENATYMKDTVLATYAEANKNKVISGQIPKLAKKYMATEQYKKYYTNKI